MIFMGMYANGVKTYTQYTELLSIQKCFPRIKTILIELYVVAVSFNATRAAVQPFVTVFHPIPKSLLLDFEL
jgi:hypothetical protein